MIPKAESGCKMRSDFEARRLLTTVKKVMTSRKLKYRDLAREMAVSLPTVKRLMNNNEIRLNQLLQICRWLDLTLPELLEQAETGAHIFKFSPEHELFFSKFPSHLAYLFELYNGHLTPNEIQKKHGISTRSTRRYLKCLRKMDLIDILPGDQIKFLIEGSIAWSDQGKLGQVFSKNMIESFSRRATEETAGPNTVVTFLNGWSWTKNNHEEFQFELKELLRKFHQSSLYNRKILKPSDYKQFSSMILVDEWEHDLFTKIAEI